MFTEAFLDIQEILDRNYRIEQDWMKILFHLENKNNCMSQINSLY